jgi:hypothetical protein
MEDEEDKVDSLAGSAGLVLYAELLRNVVAPKVGPSNIVHAGLGAFAALDVPRNALLCLYPGVVIPKHMVATLLQVRVVRVACCCD